MEIKDLMVIAEEVETGRKVIGYVCGCKSCRKAFEHEAYDHSRPIGLLTHPEELYGNVRVYTDNMELMHGNGNILQHSWNFCHEKLPEKVEHIGDESVHQYLVMDKNGRYEVARWLEIYGKACWFSHYSSIITDVIKWQLLV